MKRLLPYLVLLVLTGENQFIFSWDSTAAKYMPLLVGNVWVYSFAYISPVGSGTGYDSYRITGTQLINGKLYYIVNHTHIQLSGNYSCSSRLFFLDSPVRVDSANMNIYLNSNCGTSTEGLVDSLASGFGDSSLTCFNFEGIKTAYNDSSDYFIFNTYFNAKKFTTININGGNDQTYLLGIGLARFYSSQSHQSCNQYLKGCIINGMIYGDTSLIIGINQISTEIPESFELFQNYPNPFNPVTEIKFSIPSVGNGRDRSVIKIYNTLGHEVQVLVNESLQPGTYEVNWDASNFPSGVYFYELTSGDFIQTKKMVLLK
jgi:hypothetical protein